MYADTSSEKLDYAKALGADAVHLVKSNQADDALKEIKKLMCQARPHITFACCDCPQILKIAAEVRLLQMLPEDYTLWVVANKTRRKYSSGWN